MSAAGLVREVQVGFGLPGGPPAPRKRCSGSGTQGGMALRESAAQGRARAAGAAVSPSVQTCPWSGSPHASGSGNAGERVPGAWARLGVLRGAA